MQEGAGGDDYRADEGLEIHEKLKGLEDYEEAEEVPDTGPCTAIAVVRGVTLAKVYGITPESALVRLTGCERYKAEAAMMHLGAAGVLVDHRKGGPTDNGLALLREHDPYLAELYARHEVSAKIQGRNT